MSQSEAWDGHGYQVETPEQITLDYDVAGIGSRSIATIIDTLILWLLLTIVSCAGFILIFPAGALGEAAFGESSSAVPYVFFAVLIIVLLVIFAGYYIFFETFWHGQTPGKRLTKLRVIKDGGYPIGFLDATIRNLVRLIDYLPFYYAIGATVMVIDRRSRRLGDLAAGTLVVKERSELSAIRIDALAERPKTAPVTAFGFATPPPNAVGTVPNLNQLTAHDQGVLREYLLRRPKLSAAAAERLDSRLATALATKLGYTIYGETPGSFLARIDLVLRQEGGVPT